MKLLKYIIISIVILNPILGCSQYRWMARDPLDLNFIDFGDNKVLLYNSLGTGITLWLNKSGHTLVPNILPRNSLNVQFFLEYKREPLSKLFMISGRRRYRIRDFLYIGMDAKLYGVQDSQVSTFGLGGSVVFEWHLIRKPNFRLIYDNGVGPNLFLNPFPFGGTRFNFTTHYGLRVEQKLGQRIWSLSLYNIHISNAGIKGRERNPAMDAVGVGIGLSLP